MSQHRRTQPERTRLAVHRTAATIFVVSLALVRLAFAQGSVAAVAAAVAASILSLVALVAAGLAPSGPEPRPVPFPMAAAFSAAAVGLVALAGIGLTFAADVR